MSKSDATGAGAHGRRAVRPITFDDVAGVAPAPPRVEPRAPPRPIRPRPAAFAAARARLPPQAMREQMRRNATAISAPGPAAGAIAKLLLHDPLRLHEFLLDRFKDARALAPGGATGDAPMDRGGGAFLAPD